MTPEERAEDVACVMRLDASNKDCRRLRAIIAIAIREAEADARAEAFEEAARIAEESTRLPNEITASIRAAAKQKEG
jgi:Na+-transporting methylmalonyl-CoA/oxaloacetate decarboxylase gamma subunit